MDQRTALHITALLVFQLFVSHNHNHPQMCLVMQMTNGSKFFLFCSFRKQTISLCSCSCELPITMVIYNTCFSFLAWVYPQRSLLLWNPHYCPSTNLTSHFFLFRFWKIYLGFSAIFKFVRKFKETIHIKCNIFCCTASGRKLLWPCR